MEDRCIRSSEKVIDSWILNKRENLGSDISLPILIYIYIYVCDVLHRYVLLHTNYDKSEEQLLITGPYETITISREHTLAQNCEFPENPTIFW